MAAALAAAAVVCVDIPIGLADAGPRACDGAARALLGRARKGSSVFPPPRRYMLGRGWPAASEAGKARGDGGLSVQAYNIMPKIAELDRALDPEDQARVFETHPELAFHRRSGWIALPPKGRVAGRAPRLELLRQAGLPAPEVLLDRHPRKDAKADDLLDAAVCAVVARDLLAGRARRVPDGDPPTDARGLRMEIWF
jgi:predicted RNase H-like nuclease